MLKVLHIEDDPANRLLVRKLLGPAGYQVIDAVDGLDGIRKAFAERPDLILVDIAIPGLDGYEVTLRLRAEAELKDVPIVAITAEGNRSTSLAVGCDGFLQKPIDARTFVATIRGYLKGQKEQADDSAGEQLRLQSQRIVSHLEEKLAQLSDANARLLDLDRARKEFYRNISHELATPMTPIVGYIRLLVDGELGPVNPAQQKALHAIDECAARLRGLIDNLLDVTALETGRLRFMFKDYDLRQIVRNCVGRIKAGLQAKSINLHLALGSESFAGLGDPDRITRAIDQLLDNAVKFTPEGGRVGVRIVRHADDQFEVLVSDSGPGIPAEVQARVFDPFFQVDGSETRLFGGAGVGLAVVRGVARGHGGSARAVLEGPQVIDGQIFPGATFSMLLARSARAALAAQAQ